jgi:hypothetical protein
LSLLFATVDEKNHGSKQFSIISGCGERNLLIEAETEQMAREWIFSVEEHSNHISSAS